MQDLISATFFIDQTGTRIMGYATNFSAVSQQSVVAVSLCAQLLNPQGQQPSDKQLCLQTKPEDALALAICILTLAKDQGWTIPPNLFDLAARIPLGGKKH